MYACIYVLIATTSDSTDCKEKLNYIVKRSVLMWPCFVFAKALDRKGCQEAPMRVPGNSPKFQEAARRLGGDRLGKASILEKKLKGNQQGAHIQENSRVGARPGN